MMNNDMLNLEHYGSAVKNWKLTLLMGIVLLVLGIVVFFHPADSYLTLSVLFGVVVLLSGVLEIYYGANTPGAGDRTASIAAGAVEIILGLWLFSAPILLMSALPFVLGFWLLYRGSRAIAAASDMRAEGIKRTGWITLWGALVMVGAFFVLFHPVVGGGLAVVWIGFTLLFAGLNLIAYAIRLAALRREASLENRTVPRT